MRLLTGATPNISFVFVPLSIVAFGSRILVEGYDKEQSVSWVHAWTVADGIITQVREYFNTSVTVTRFGNASVPSRSLSHLSVWRSKLDESVGKSVPGLVLAI
ncbi:hypothetical protein L1049_013288 [Liquidambar formosana]|uniref:Wound-induced protein 1 n=1 Tax=Liquidambar formosana TaxID=63359 RepID=A0AAP0WTY8_LIQFO